jgi:ATP-dependent Clp protease ATP-binding subunit ClpA
MLDRLKTRLHDMTTIATLCLTAERCANERGLNEVGAEHFVLAALALPDGTARRVFERLGADPDGFAEAIVRQYGEALSSIGVDPALAGEYAAAPPVASQWRRYRAHPSAQQLMRALSKQQRADPKQPLMGAHVLMAAVSGQFGVTLRALRCMGIDPHALDEVARQETLRGETIG